VICKLNVCNIFRYLPFIQVRQRANTSTSRIFKGYKEENESLSAGIHFTDYTSTVQAILDGRGEHIMRVYDNF